MIFMLIGKNIKFALAVFSVFVLALLILFQQAGQNEEKDKTDKTNTENNYSFIQGEETGEQQERKEEGSSFMNLFESFKKDCQYAPDTGDNSEEQERVFISLEDLKKGFAEIAETGEVFSDDTDSERVHKLSDEEYFVNFYGEQYVVYLNALQDLMVGDGYIEESEKMELKTEQDTYSFFIKFVDYALEKGYIDKEAKRNVESGIKVLIELNKNERPAMESRIIDEISALDLPDGLLDRVASYFISTARAVGEVDIGIECYRPSPPGMDCKGSIVPAGFNGWSFCCNCGLFCSYGCKYVPDCSKETCNVQMGCLNAVCPRSAAIWDVLGVFGGTGICGCACPGG